MAMVETQSSSKRQRDEEQVTQIMLEDPKRQKSYNHILSLLDEDEEEPTQDINSLITTLQQELSSSSSSSSSFDALTNPNHPSAEITADASSECYNSSSSGSVSPSSYEQEDESSVERVMRHLLEASDDELGIPHREASSGFGDAGVFDFGDNGISLCDGLWELEDEAANYYTLVQSELFM